MRGQHALTASRVERSNSGLSDELEQLAIYTVGDWVWIYNTTATTSQGAKPGTDQEMSACSVKTRRALFRHCRDGRVYGHTTTTMHDNESPPPAPPSRPQTESLFSGSASVGFEPWRSQLLLERVAALPALT